MPAAAHDAEIEALTVRGAFQRLSIVEVAAMLRLRRSAVSRAVDAGELPHERHGSARYVRVADADAWAREQFAGQRAPEPRLTGPKPRRRAAKLPIA